MQYTLGKTISGLPGPILITGHTGFKGTWLTFLMEKIGVPVVGISLSPTHNSLYERTNRLGLISEKFMDIRNHEEINKVIKHFRPSVIIHLAAQPLVLESYKTPRQTFDVNVMGTANILEAAFNCESVMAVIVVTSDKVYKNDDLLLSFTEESALAGKDPYSASKVGAESAVSAWQQIAINSGGPSVVSVRAGNVLGGGDWAANRLLPDLIRGFSSNETIKIRNPGNTRPWQHVLDPLTGYILALESALMGNTHKAINFGPTGVSLSVHEVVTLATASWGSAVDLHFIPDSKEPSAEARTLNLNSSLAQESLGWEPHWSQTDAVISTVNWWNGVLRKNQKPYVACMIDIESTLDRYKKNTLN